jgi:anthranilate synthase/aminodeoxychorismate synthase-like glutamine amidotransferase
MLLMIDNYDSFTYNLVQYFGELGQPMRVFRNDRLQIDEIRDMAPRGIVISPGPGKPAAAGISCSVIETFAGAIPILGVCLGHQCIAEVFGGNIIRAGRIMHGKTSRIFHAGAGVFMNLPNPFEATRYHSLIAERQSLPDCLEITAWTSQDEIMGIRHKRFFVEGIQFHPESILTINGKQLLGNFLAAVEAYGNTADQHAKHPT